MSSEDHSATADLKEKLLYSIRSLTEIGEELSSAEEFESHSRAVLHLMMGTLVISKSAIMLCNEACTELRVCVSRGIDGAPLALRLPREVRSALHAIGKPFRITDPPDEKLRPFFKEHAEELRRLHSYLWVPLCVRARLLGVVSVSKKFMGGDYQEVDLELLNIIAKQLSIAINNFRLIHSLKTTNFQLNRKLLELETLYDLGIAIGTLKEVRDLSEQILINAVGLTDASAGLLALKTDDGGLELAAGINLPFEDLSEIEGHEVLWLPIEQGESWMNNDADPAETFGFSKLLLVPLRGQHEIEGLIGLADKESRDGGLLDFTAEDEHLLANFGSQAGIAIENAKFYAESVEKERLERELQVAASIQQNLLPESPPEVPGIEIAATTIPSHTVGGDHFDFLQSNGEYLISIADVSGKGIPAALLVSTLHATLHAHAEGETDLGRMVGRISRSIFASSLSNKFITFAVSRLDPATMTLRSVNAGHNYPLLVSREGEIRLLRAGGLALGLLPESKYIEEEISLRPGDLLVYYTDGVTESLNTSEEEFGDERFEKLLVKRRQLSAREILDSILGDIETFTAGAPQHDDLTLIVIKVAE